MTELFREAEASGITVEYCRIPLNESISVQDTEGDFVLMDYSLIEAGAKERVHLAHELGHCVTGSFYNRYAARDVRQKHEHRADKWAIQQIVPQAEFDRAVADGCATVWDLAERFSVTEEFMRKAICLYTNGNLAVELYGA